MMTKILIAEDERDIRDLIIFTLRYHGYDVAAATNGEEALELALSEHPDLIILDVRMPRMTGYDVCREIKANKATDHIPVAFLSAKGQEAEVQAGMDAGAIAYILKPFAPDELVARVREFLAAGEEDNT
jgi:DNA-binding response OmpR family regulator